MIITVVTNLNDTISGGIYEIIDFKQSMISQTKVKFKQN